MEDKIVEMELTPINLKSNNIGEMLELTFNIGGIFCPISTLLGLGVGAYNKKLAQDNLDYLVLNLNKLIHNQDFLIKKIKMLEKENKKLSNIVFNFSEKVNDATEYLKNQEQIVIDIKHKSEEELRSFSFNIQNIVNTTIQEKSKAKIEEYSEYVVQTILDDLIFTSNDSFDYVLNVIKSLNENDIGVLEFIDKQRYIVYDNQFSSTRGEEYLAEDDDFLSLQKLIKLGLVEFESKFYVPHRSYMEEGDVLDIDKSYSLTSFFYSIKKYLKFE